MKSERRAYAFTDRGGIVSRGLSPAGADVECSWHRQLLGLLPIAALYLVLGFYQIDGQSLWTDEVISVNRTSQSLWARVQSQSPVYFIMLDFWTHTFGTSEFALRSLSTFVGLLAIFLVYAIGLRLFGIRIAVIGALLLSTSPYFIWYAQEVRYITLLLATSLAMTYSFQRALTDGGRRWWVLYGLSSALALFTFLTVVFLLLAQGLYLLCDRSRRPLLKQWVASQLVIIVLFAGWFVDRTAHKLGAVLSQRPSIVSQDQDRRSREKLPLSDLVGTIPYTLFTFSVGFSLGPSLKELHESRSVETLLKHAPALIPVAMLFASLFVLGLRRLRRESGMGLFLLLWLGVPVIGVFIVASTTTYHVFNTRYVAMALPAYLLIVATGIAGFRSCALQGALLVAVIAVNGLSLFNYYFDSRYARADARAAAKYLVSAARPGDAILAVGSATALRYYYKGKLPIARVNSRSANSVIVENIQELGKKHARLWLVEIRPWQSDPKGKVRAALDKLAGLGEQKMFAGADVYGYQLRGQRAGSGERGAGSGEQGVGSSERGVESRGQRAEGREQRVGSREQGAEGRR